VYNISKESKEFKETGGRTVELSRISSKGQVTIPIDIRKKLSLKEGDKVLFVEEEGKVFITNASLVALQKIQVAMEGEAEFPVAVPTPSGVRIGVESGTFAVKNTI
jgi:AbrB family looped-hinge helix DNA binding protein